MRRLLHTRPLKKVEQKDLDDTFIKLEYWDPYFWEKATHVLSEFSKEGDKCRTHFEYYMKANEVLGQLDAGEGYVYILVSEQNEGLCKIGSTERTPEERLKEINAGTGVIFPWKLYDAFPCKAPRSVEKLVHKVLGEVRVDPRKEGFAIYPKIARETILRVLTENQEKFVIES